MGWWICGEDRKRCEHRERKKIFHIGCLQDPSSLISVWGVHRQCSERGRDRLLQVQPHLTLTLNCPLYSIPSCTLKFVAVFHSRLEGIYQITLMASAAGTVRMLPYLVIPRSKENSTIWASAAWYVKGVQDLAVKQLHKASIILSNGYWHFTPSIIWLLPW